MHAEVIRDLGETRSEHSLKQGFLQINASLQFDVGGRTGSWHPQIETRQSVYYNNQFVAPMERGIVPEHNVWGVGVDKLGNKRKSHIIKVGWRYTMLTLVTRRVPGFTWDRLIEVFKLDRKAIIPQDLAPEVPLKEHYAHLV